MNLFEYQGKRMFQEYGVQVPKSQLVISRDEEITLVKGVIKPQVLIGGRGKAGAIRFFESKQEAKELIDHFLTTPIRDHLATKILLEEKIEIEKEYYFSIFIDRSKRCISLMFSDDGGVEVEKNADRNLSIVDINPLIGLRDYHINTLLSDYTLKSIDKIKKTILQLYLLFSEKKMMLLEVNPLALSKDDEIIALDAKVTLDDWYVDEQLKEESKGTGIQTEMEKSISSVGGFPVQMDGNIAVYAAGAGASMAIGDSITQQGGKLCALIDKGNMPTDTEDKAVRTKVAKAMRSLLELNPKVIVVNVFYQAGRVDHECAMIRLAFEEESKKIPVLVRCKGRKSEEGKKILEKTQIRVFDSLSELCSEAVRLSEVN